MIFIPLKANRIEKNVVQHEFVLALPQRDPFGKGENISAQGEAM